MALVEELIKTGYLKTAGIIEAFKRIERVDFLPQDLKALAEVNEALPIGSGQTISQPLVVAFMLELLQPVAGERILDVGSGSGWTTALLAQLVGQSGKVFALEVVPGLKEFGEKNVAKYSFLEKGTVKFICADASKGYRTEAPFDKILASAAAEKVPRAWKEQLKVGGRIVAPLDSSIWLLIKKSEKEFKEKEYPGFVFVPLVKK